jgi:hypothetical protein
MGFADRNVQRDVFLLVLLSRIFPEFTLFTFRIKRVKGKDVGLHHLLFLPCFLASLRSVGCQVVYRLVSLDAESLTSPPQSVFE